MIPVLLKAIKRGDDRTQSLFDMPVQVAGSTDRHGHVRAPYTRVQKVRATLTPLADLFSAPVAAKDAALRTAISHLKEDAQQADIPKKEQKEDAALISKLQAAADLPAAAPAPPAPAKVVQVTATPAPPTLSPEARDILGYTEHLAKPAVIMAAVALRHQHGLQDPLRAQVAMLTPGKVPEAADLNPGERATAAWLASTVPLTRAVSIKTPTLTGVRYTTEDQPITAASQLAGDGVRDALLNGLGFGRRFLYGGSSQPFTPEGLDWGAMQAGSRAVERGYGDNRPEVWAARAKGYLERQGDLARAKYLLGSSAYTAPKTPGEQFGVMATITRLGLVTPEQVAGVLERDWHLAPPLKKEVQAGAPSLEALIAGTAALDDLIVQRLVGSTNQAKVQAFAEDLRNLHGQLRQLPAALDKQKSAYWTAREAAIQAAGWREEKTTSAFDRKQVFGLRAPGGGFIDLGHRSMTSFTPLFTFPGEAKKLDATERVPAVLRYLESLGRLRTPTAEEVADAQPKPVRVVTPPAPVAYVPVHPAKRQMSAADYYARGTPEAIKSGPKAIRSLMRRDLKQAVTDGRLPDGLKVSITGDHNSINLRLTGVPAGMPVRNPDWDVAQANEPDRVPPRWLERYAPATQQVLDDLDALHAKYNWDRSDHMTDYFDVNYYGSAQVALDLEHDQSPVPDPRHAAPGATLTRGGVTYVLTGDPPRWHRQADPAPAAKPAKVAKVVSVTPTKTPADRERQAAKLRALADGLTAKAETRLNADRLTNTAKRAHQASHALKQGEVQAATATTLRNLADAIASGEADHLAGITNVAQVEALDEALSRAMLARDQERWSYAERERQGGRPPDLDDLAHVTWPRAEIHDSNLPALQAALQQVRGGPSVAASLANGLLTAAAAVQIKRLLGDQAERLVGWYPVAQLTQQARYQRAGIQGLTDLQAALGEYLRYRAGAKAIDPIKAAELALAGKKVGIDFFPTPKDLATRMADLAGIQPGMRVLEPSAGHGNLADAARAAGATVDTIEVSEALRAVLTAKGYPLVERRFEDFTPAAPYHAVIMNPPFSSRLDAAHIQRAYTLLQPGGTLVAIAGEGVFSGQDQAAQGFRDWLDTRGAMIEKLPAGTFLDRTLPQTTGVNARLLVVHKPAEQHAEPVQPPAIADDELMELGLLRNFNGRWFYKTEVTGRFYQANTHEDARAQALRTYDKTPEDQRLTQEQRFAASNAQELAALEAQYGHLDLPQLQHMYERMGPEITQLQEAGRREFNGGGRRTAPAVAAEGARNVAEERRRLGRYLEARQQREVVKPTPPAVPNYDDELRADIGLTLEQLANYVPAQQVTKGYRGTWGYTTTQGNPHPGTFNTKRDALAAAESHLKLRQAEWDNPSGYRDIISVRARRRSARAEELMRTTGMTEMAAYQRAREEIPNPGEALAKALPRVTSIQRAA